MRKNRIILWIVCLVVSFGIVKGETFIRKTFFTEKASLYVYAPEDMESAFKRVLKFAGMKSDYKIVMTDEKMRANVIVENNKEFNSEYTKIAFSPFVVAYSTDSDCLKKLEKSGVLNEAFFNNEYYEINLLKVIEEVIGEGRWENFGLKDLGKIKIYYPSRHTSYWSDFYDFMLVTVNNGVYPETETELKNAMEKIHLFENSSYTEATDNFNEKLERNGGFLENIFFILPEKDIGELASSYREYGRLFYPTTTVYYNYYIKVDEIGSRLIKHFEDSDHNFYYELKLNDYRNDFYSNLDEITNFLYDERDVYNVLHLDADRIKPADLKDIPAEN